MAGLMATHSSHLGDQYLNQASLKEKYTVQEVGLQRDSEVEVVDGVHQGCNQHIPCRTQRPLIGKHVNELLGKMKRNGIRRTEITDRLKVSLTYEEFEASLEYTMKAYAHWFKDKVPRATKAYTKDKLVKKYRQALCTVVGFRQLAIFLTDPEKSPNYGKYRQ